MAENHYTGSGCPQCAFSKFTGSYFNDYFQKFPDKTGYKGYRELFFRGKNPYNRAIEEAFKLIK